MGTTRNASRNSSGGRSSNSSAGSDRAAARPPAPTGDRVASATGIAARLLIDGARSTHRPVEILGPGAALLGDLGPIDRLHAVTRGPREDNVLRNRFGELDVRARSVAEEFNQRSNRLVRERLLDIGEHRFAFARALDRV